MLDRPEYLKRGERARLFPILADTSREQRIASIFLALLQQIPDMADVVLGSVGRKVGKRTTVDAYTEVVFKNQEISDFRPDGFVVVKTGNTSWSALVEAKIGKASLDVDQVERYLEIARSNCIDAVITISNEFVTQAEHSPVRVSKKLLRKTGLFHWSWMWIATQSDILINRNAVSDTEQNYLLGEFLRFINHPATGVERFNQMGSTWKDLVQTVTNQGVLKRSAPEVEEGVSSWIAEERDLCLQLCRHVGQAVETVIESKLRGDPAARFKAEADSLIETQCFRSRFRVPDSAADIELLADVARRTLTVGMKLRAPKDKQSTKARLNWLLKMLKHTDPRLFIRAHWPGSAAPTMHSLMTLRDNPEAIQHEKKEVAPHSFEILLVAEAGKRFSGRRTLIEDIEEVVPTFYDLVGQHLRAWQAPPPKPVKSKDMDTLEEVESSTVTVDAAISSQGEIAG